MTETQAKKLEAGDTVYAVYDAALPFVALSVFNCHSGYHDMLIVNRPQGLDSKTMPWPQGWDREVLIHRGCLFTTLEEARTRLAKLIRRRIQKLDRLLKKWEV